MPSKPIKSKTDHLRRGENAEQLAYDYLIKQGLMPISRNFRCKHGELDLIMTDQQTLAIIEVRYRKSDHFGSAAESVTLTKQSRIITATQVFLATHRFDCPIRFDVVAISGNGSVNWIKNAFNC